MTFRTINNSYLINKNNLTKFETEKKRIASTFSQPNANDTITTRTVTTLYLFLTTDFGTVSTMLYFLYFLILLLTIDVQTHIYKQSAREGCVIITIPHFPKISKLEYGKQCYI